MKYKKKRKIRLKTEREIKIMEKSSRIVGIVLESIKEYVRPGISTFEIDNIAEKMIIQEGGRPKFKGYEGFPKSLCTSLNDEVVHGIPSKERILEEGDIFSIDVGVEYEGFCGDGAATFPVGKISDLAQKLIQVTEESLYCGIRVAVENNYISDISRAIQEHVERHGFSVIRALVGHGIGRNLHEEPQVPNFDVPGRRGSKLVCGMVLAIEPMVNAGSYEIEFSDDRWTARTKDGSLSAHFEHTVAITKDGPRILTNVR